MKNTKFPVAYMEFLVLLGSTLIASFDVQAANYYLSPTGNDAGTGSMAAPWKTFAFAIPKLLPGDMLVLKDGVYNASNSGYPALDCNSANASNGTPSHPITLRSEHERRAFLSTNGRVNALRIENCSYWNIEGLYAKGADNPSSPFREVVFVRYSSHLAFKRLLLTHNNRYGNTHLLLLWDSDRILVEESEFYSFHRHSIALVNTNNSLFRRNFANSRAHADIEGGWVSTGRTRGQSGLAIYPGSYNIAENNISEGNRSGISMQATRTLVNNQLLGNISLHDMYGVGAGARGSGDKIPLGTVISNAVTVEPIYYGLSVRAGKDTLISNLSAFGGEVGIVADVDPSVPGDGLASLFSTNSLIVGAASYAIVTTNHVTWSHNYPNIFNTGASYNPTTYIAHASSHDPKLGACTVWIPDDSPMKGKGKGGADIGANILYRYVDGVLTDEPLWNPNTGEFPCGAIVAGVNDIPGTSCFDVHQRLNVNTNGCAFPEGYGKTTGTNPPTPPSPRR
ncbi:MAG: right-handed parallel beta-helix repeat-containing protein [Myxococcota bacterium]